MKYIHKKIIVLVIALIGCKIYADEITLGKVDCIKLENGSVYDRECRLRYDGNYYLQINSSYTVSWIEIDQQQLESLRNMMLKFNEWKQIAKENKVDVNKEIPNSKISSNVSWQDGKKFCSSSYKITLSFYFTTINNGESASLLLMSTEVHDESNKYFTFETGDILFIDSSADEFIEMISQPNIDKKIEENKNEKSKTDNLFN